MVSMFRSLGSFNFRVWFFGALISGTGMWMQTTAQAWVVLVVLTDGDARAMGVTMACQYAPQVLLAGFTGWISDRFDRRRVVFLSQLTMLALSAALGLLIIGETITLPLMFGFALLYGVVQALDTPSRLAFVSDLVDGENASNAIALNAAAFNSARLVGPAAAGIGIVSFGTGVVFLVNSVFFMATLVALLTMRKRELRPSPRPEGRQRFLDGIVYVMRRRDLRFVVIGAFFVAAFSMNFPFFSSTMALEFGVDADGFGLLTSLLAIGSLSGALVAARFDRPRLRLAIIAGAVLGLAIGIAACMPHYWLFGIMLSFCGFGAALLFATLNGYLQTTTPSELRGRALAVYVAIVIGAAPAGAPLLGIIATHLGPRSALVAGACAALIGIVACMLAVAAARNELNTLEA